MNSVKTDICDLEQRMNEELLLFKLVSFCFEEDVKASTVSKKLLDKFNTLGGILYADKYKLSSIIPDEIVVLEILDLFKRLMNSMLGTRIQNTNIINNRDQLLDYLKFKMGRLDIEQCRILLLNKQNILLADEVVSEGTLDTVSFYPREIVKKALFHGASAIIIAHNHPSGKPEASANDLVVTDKIIKACNVFDISVHDHIIVTKDSYFSCLSS